MNQIQVHFKSTFLGLIVPFSMLVLNCYYIYAVPNVVQKDPFFDQITIKVDTAIFNSSKYLLNYQGERCLFFRLNAAMDFAEITLQANEEQPLSEVQLLPSADFILVDSLRKFEETYYRAKIRFNQLDNARLPSLIFSLKTANGKSLNYQIKLFPYLESTISNDNESIDLFVDEEKAIELQGTNIENIKYYLDPALYPDDEVRITPSINSVLVKIKPKSIGPRNLELKLKVHRPFVHPVTQQLCYELDPIKIRINVKPNRIDYVNPDRGTLYYNADFKTTQEIQFDFNKNMILRKTYRIEDQSETGGNLIAEIYTQSQVGNSNKTVARIRTFALHRSGEGYLYIKDGDKTRFLTNFDIIEKPRIDEISIFREGTDDWNTALNVFPGDKLEVRIKGTGMLTSRFKFDGAEQVRLDSSRLSDEVSFYTLRIPKNTPKRKINIFMNQIATQYALQVREYQNPRDFDFIQVNYGDKSIPATSDFFNKPIFYEGTIKDINLAFDGNKIDDDKLYGKQFVNLEIKIYNSKNDLLEIQNVPNIAICPSNSSIRGAYYDTKECRNQTISLNDYLFHKTYNLESYTQIYITISHNESKYSGPGFNRKIKLILSRKTKFDLDLSFPAGLIFYKFDDGNTQTNTSGNAAFRNLWGISIAFIAQLSFYEPQKVNRFKPYTIGAGFIAINALDFSPNANRDLGVVALGTIVPLQAKKLSFPLYLGGGYLLVERKWFVVFGPGVRVSF